METEKAFQFVILDTDEENLFFYEIKCLLIEKTFDQNSSEIKDLAPGVVFKVYTKLFSRH